MRGDQTVARVRAPQTQTTTLSASNQSLVDSIRGLADILESADLEAMAAAGTTERTFKLVMSTLEMLKDRSNLLEALDIQTLDTLLDAAKTGAGLKSSKSNAYSEDNVKRFFQAPPRPKARKSVAPSKIRPIRDLTWRRFQAADRAIRTARKFTPYGMGNQVRDIYKSGGASYARMSKARDATPDSAGLAGVAKVAARYGGANCGEMASMTYSALVAKGNAPGPIQYISLDHEDHAFTMLGDPRERTGAVVVDGWMRRPSAHRWRESRWNSHVGAVGGASVVQSWNDSRPHAAFDFTKERMRSVDTAKEVEEMGFPGANLASLLLVVHEQRQNLWDVTHPGANDQPLRYSHR